MTTNHRIAIGTAALIGGSLVFAGSTPSSASPPTRFDVCPAILSEPICDLVRTPEQHSSGSGGTKPAVVPEVAEGLAADVDIGCGRTSIGSSTVCPA